MGMMKLYVHLTLKLKVWLLMMKSMQQLSDLFLMVLGFTQWLMLAIVALYWIYPSFAEWTG